MKTATFNDIDTINFVDNKLVEYKIRNHRYPLPTPRSELYSKLLVERDARNPESLLEPEQGSILSADVDYEYNYYVPRYEQLGAIPGVSRATQILPDLNMFLAYEEDYLDIDQRKDFNTLFTAFNTLPDDFTGRHLLSRDYFVDFGFAVSKLSDDERIIQSTRNTTFVNKKMRDLYLDNENKREMFPYFGKISIEGFADSEVASILQTHKLDKRFCEYLAMHREDHSKDATYVIVPSDKPTPIVRNVKYYSLLDLYTHLDDNHGGGQTYEVAQTTDSTCAYFENFLLGTMARNRFEKYIESSEVGTSTPVAFRLEKYDKSTFISSHYFFNYEEMSNFKFFDTQVHYDHVYEYRVNIINSVVAEEASTGKKHLIFLEEFFYKDDFYILDSPPIPPDIELITYRGVSDKLLILFNQMIDKRAMVPIYINESDLLTFERQYQAQKIDKPDPIVFESDDPTNFELFKCMKHPSSYSEFANPFYKIIYSDEMTAASYTDTIIPNQTYYYMFRALDMHGFCSNPSPIYEFTLIKEGETMYPRIRTVELAKPDPPVQKSKDFKKYIKIGFAPEQMQLDPDSISLTAATNIVGKHIAIGTREERIVGSNRKFKFRIRSKNTGKLIDINVTFKKNKVIKA
ncbi:MAG: hypothetical protein GOVbin703_71 [Prokaryotic dsDNA virus sp.]|nr:MAG: hypothetical protein GOVbin703_71 [Prokaryotic dsDNA virus sp.]|tara:strand:+ start:25777 stop:27669 length:1893 start_codon:yes stop_codon:yes gene_type:complete